MANGLVGSGVLEVRVEFAADVLLRLAVAVVFCEAFDREVLLPVVETLFGVSPCPVVGVGIVMLRSWALTRCNESSTEKSSTANWRMCRLTSMSAQVAVFFPAVKTVFRFSRPCFAQDG